MKQLKHILHTIFDGGLNFTFYTYEKNNRDIIWSKMYNPIWAGLLYFIVSFFCISSYIYVHITGSIPIAKVPIGISIAIISATISNLTVKRLKKEKFAEKAYKTYQTYTLTEKKHLAIKGFLCNVLPIGFYPLIILAILKFLV